MYHRLLFFLLLLAPAVVQAQEPFIEGTLTYSVSLQPANGQESLGTQAGTYTLTLKGVQVRRELRMNSGYQSAVLYDGRSGTGAMLQTTPSQKFAVQLSAADMTKRRGPWAQFSFRPEGKPETRNGQTCQPGRAVYASGPGTTLCLGTTPLAADAWLFGRFPGITAIPLQFEYKNRDGGSVQFRLERLETTPVEAAQFRVPADYKIIPISELHDAGE